MEDSAAEGHLNWKLRELVQEVPEEKKSFSMLPRIYSSDILMNNVAAFCPCLKILPETKVKVNLFGLIPLADKSQNSLV